MLELIYLRRSVSAAVLTAPSPLAVDTAHNRLHAGNHNDHVASKQAFFSSPRAAPYVCDLPAILALSSHHHASVPRIGPAFLLANCQQFLCSSNTSQARGPRFKPMGRRCSHIPTGSYLSIDSGLCARGRRRVR